MRLSVKLFVVVGVLLVVICGAVYLVPAHLAKTELSTSQREFLNEVALERRKNWQANMLWLTQRIGDLEAWIDAGLLYALEHPSHVLSSLQSHGPNLADAWMGAARILSHSPHMNFLEVTENDQLKVGITLSRTRLHTAKKYPIDEGVAWLSLVEFGDKAPPGNEVCIGIWIPNRLQRQATTLVKPTGLDAEVFLLFDPLTLYRRSSDSTSLSEQDKEQLIVLGEQGITHPIAIAEILLAELDRAVGYLKKEFHTENELTIYMDGLRESGQQIGIKDLITTGHASYSEDGSRIDLVEGVASDFTSMEWAAFWDELMRIVQRRDETELIEALGFLSGIPGFWSSPIDRQAPVGAASFFPKQAKGTGVLSRDAFENKVLFDASRHFQQYPPAAARLPLASGFGLVDEEKAGAATLVNVGRFPLVGKPGEYGYISLGGSLAETIERLARVAGETTMLIQKGKVVQYTGPKSQTVSKRLLDAVDDRLSDFDRPTGFINLVGKDYYYSFYQPKAQWDLGLLTLAPAEPILAAMQRFETSAKEMANQLSWRLMVFAVAALIIALAILQIIAIRFTKPMRSLARAAETIGEGRYREVELPKVSKYGRDEVSLLTRSFDEMRSGLIERDETRGVLNKVVSQEVAAEILSGKVPLGGEVRDVAVLFADLRNFTEATANLPPEQVITFVNSYMAKMSDIVDRHRGVVDKYIGDSLMALFGAPIAHEYALLQAVVTALAIKAEAAEWNEERQQQGLPVAEIGMGIQWGPVVAGNVGGENRLNYTVLGRNVNLASRLCHSAKGGQILVTPEVLQDPHVAAAIAFEEHEPLKLKGFDEPMVVFEIAGLQQGYLLSNLDHLAIYGEPPQED